MTRLRLLIAMVVALGVMVAGGAPAAAHTGFESSTPADGSTVDQPVDVVTLVFTGEANPVGDGVVALTPDGVLQQPTSIDTVDGQTLTVTFDPPLAGGQVGIRWNVQAADAHPIEGAFSFTVSAPASTTTEATTTTTAATTSVGDAASSVDEPAGSNESVEAPDATSSTQPAVVAPVGEAPPDETSSDDATLAGEETADAAVETQSLEEFLTVDDSVPGETMAATGRLIGFLGVGFGLGAFAFLATAMRGRRDEVSRLVLGVRVLGAAIAVGAAIEYVGVARIADESLGSAWSTSAGFATVLRIVGGLVLAVGVAGRIERLGDGPLPGLRPLSAAAARPLVLRGPFVSVDPPEEPTVRWRRDARSRIAVTGAVVVLVSFWFDGHTVSKGFRPLHALVNSVHVAAGAVWVGGVATMAVLAWTRLRRDRPARLADMVVHFSGIATLMLGAVAAAGGMMAFLVLDSLGDLTGTEWGRILLLKTSAVGLAALAGAYNHFRLVPALEEDPDAPDTLATLRSTLTAEAILLAFVVSVTAWLVAAAS